MKGKEITFKDKVKGFIILNFHFNFEKARRVARRHGSLPVVRRWRNC